MQLVLHYGISHANLDNFRIKSHAESAEWKEWLARRLYYCTQTFIDLKGLYAAGAALWNLPRKFG